MKLQQRLARHLFWIAALALAMPLLPASAQTSLDSVRGAQAERSRQRADTSELAKENRDRVAAAARDIQAILAKDPGLLVELKHIVAREATESGQVVEDTELTDQAIFDRLTQDVTFRAAATRLLRQYGYLLPTVNPDSEIAKQQELLLKERARRLVQIEEKENQESLQPHLADRQRAQLAALPCDDDSTAECVQGSTSDDRQTDGKERGQSESPTPPKRQQLNSSQTLQANDSSKDMDLFDSAPSPLDGLGMSRERSAGQDGLQLTALTGPSVRRDQQTQSLLPPSGSPQRADVLTAGNSDVTENSSTRSVRSSRTSIAPSDRDLPPVAMIHKPNPFSDVPSLYDMYVQASSKSVQPERFGLSIFRRDSLRSNAIPMDLPAGPEYVIGPGDGLAIDIWGGVSQRMLRTVDRQGRLTLPEVGPILVSGHTLGDVQRDVQQLLRTQYRDVSADVSLSRLRTVRIYVVGEVAEPGAYDISSLSTPLNALYAAGGVTARGSLRTLKHFRGKRLVAQIDAYDLLLRGVQTELAHLENGDTLLVPPIGPQVTIDGMVRRPAIYELTDETSLADVIQISGGILPAAALKHIEVQRLEAHEKRTMLSLDISQATTSESVAAQLSAFKIQDGDQIHLFPIAPYNESAIYLQGHVLRPGRYSFHEGMKLAEVVASYGDLLPEPAQHYAEIVRLNPPDFRPTVESFDLATALESPAVAPVLKSHDTIRIFSRYDFEPAPWVWVGGEVRSPGKYNTSGQVHLRDALHLAGGVSADASLESAQLYRTQSDGTMRIFNVNLREALNGNPADNPLLEPRDRLLIQKNTAAVQLATVDVRGEVARPGRYPYATGMRVEDLLNVAGGLKRSADFDSADLTRYAATEPAGNNGSVKVNLAAVANGNPTEDLPLRPGDVLTIRQRPGWINVGASVTLRGEVMHPGTYGIQPGERLSSVIQRAGGFSTDAYPYGAVLMRTEVREMELQSRDQLVQRVKSQQLYLRAQPDADADQKAAKLTALAQTDTALTQLMASNPVGRVVLHVKPGDHGWDKTAADVPVQSGDVLVVPKKTQYVTVMGQVFNPTAVEFQSGRSARWYLSQAGGLTQLANKKGVFVIRADGSVIAAKNNSGLWSGDPLTAVLRPGDSVVVPEKALNVGQRNWTPILQAAQVAASVALTVAYIKP